MAQRTAFEQLQLELINRARLDPVAEAARLGIALNEGVSAADTISAAAKQPLAGNTMLKSAADGHTSHMINVDQFGHSGIGDDTMTSRIQGAGYTPFLAIGENIAASTGSNQAVFAVQLYENLFRDVGIAGRGHRTNLLSNDFNEVGLSLQSGNFTPLGGSSTLVTQNFGSQGKLFITGVAYNDTNGNKFYDIGEGRGGVNVKVGASSVTSESAGGYDLAVGSASGVAVTFSGGGLPSAVNATVTSTTPANIKVDLVGTNTILSSGNTTLGAGALNLTLLGVNGLTGVGNANDNVIDGTSGGNVLYGGEGADTLRGHAGNDTLRGTNGVDRLEGGQGNDVLNGGAGGDALIGGDGTDTAFYSEYTTTVGVTARLDIPAANRGEALGDTYSSIENLVGSQHGDVLVGDAGVNTLSGVGGNDAIYGQAGADILIGGAGFDFLEGGAGADVLNGGADFDYAGYAFATAPVTANLANKALNTGDAAGDSYILIDGLAGSKFNDKLTGDGGGNIINGGLGNDTLAGGAGADAFVFSTALNAATNVDTITDFNAAADVMWIDNAVFTALGAATGVLAAAKFFTGAAAHDADDRIVYNKATGDIFYDSNGNGAGGMTKFAHVAANTDSDECGFLDYLNLKILNKLNLAVERPNDHQYHQSLRQLSRLIKCVFVRSKRYAKYIQRRLFD